MIDQSDQSVAPGILPDRVHVRDDPAGLTPEDRPADDGQPRTRGLRGALAKVAIALRGDKNMLDAYVAVTPEAAQAPDNPASSIAGKR